MNVSGLAFMRFLYVLQCKLTRSQTYIIIITVRYKANANTTLHMIIITINQRIYVSRSLTTISLYLHPK